MINWNSLYALTPSHRAADASELCLAPGEWPQSLRFRDGPDGVLVFGLFHVNANEQNEPVTVRYECRPAGLFLTVYND